MQSILKRTISERRFFQMPTTHNLLDYNTRFTKKLDRVIVFIINLYFFQISILLQLKIACVIFSQFFCQNHHRHFTLDFHTASLWVFPITQYLQVSKGSTRREGRVPLEIYPVIITTSSANISLQDSLLRLLKF